MNQLKTKPLEQPIKNWILYGIPILFVVSSLMHFLYEWSGESVIVGLFAPVNESVWEHLKMTYLPTLLWWLLGLIILSPRTNVSASRWICSCAVSVLTCPLVIVSFFYTYTGALGIDSLLLDILSLLLGILAGQVLALHTYQYANFRMLCVYVSILLILLLGAAFVLFTFNPPHIPLFMDFSTGTYGI